MTNYRYPSGKLELGWGIIVSKDNTKMVGALLIDLSKAFDSVLHQLLLLELEQIGCGTGTIQCDFR